AEVEQHAARYGARGERAAVGAERDRPHRRVLAQEVPAREVVLEVPERHAVGAARRDEEVRVRRDEREAEGRAGMRAELAARAAVEVDDDERTLPGAGREAAAVGRQRGDRRVRAAVDAPPRAV